MNTVIYRYLNSLSNILIRTLIACRMESVNRKYMIRIGTGSLLKKNKEIYAIVFVQDYLKNCQNRDYKRFLTQYKFQVTLVVMVLSQCIPPPLCAFANRVDQQFLLLSGILSITDG